MLSAMDQSVNPCTDFYQFSCGGWIKKAADGDSRFSQASQNVMKLGKEILDDLVFRNKNSQNLVSATKFIIVHLIVTKKNPQLELRLSILLLLSSSKKHFFK